MFLFFLLSYFWHKKDNNFDVCVCGNLNCHRDWLFLCWITHHKRQLNCAMELICYFVKNGKQCRSFGYYVMEGFKSICSGTQEINPNFLRKDSKLIVRAIEVRWTNKYQFEYFLCDFRWENFRDYLASLRDSSSSRIVDVLDENFGETDMCNVEYSKRDRGVGFKSTNVSTQIY